MTVCYSSSSSSSACLTKEWSKRGVTLKDSLRYIIWFRICRLLCWERYDTRCRRRLERLFVSQDTYTLTLVMPFVRLACTGKHYIASRPDSVPEVPPSKCVSRDELSLSQCSSTSLVVREEKSRGHDDFYFRNTSLLSWALHVSFSLFCCRFYFGFTSKKSDAPAFLFHLLLPAPKFCDCSVCRSYFHFVNSSNRFRIFKSILYSSCLVMIKMIFPEINSDHVESICRVEVFFLFEYLWLLDFYHAFILWLPWFLFLGKHCYSL